eukprot:196183_1
MSLMSPVRRCTNATYMTTMDESRGDRLSRGQILASSNCEYKLCAESNRLSLYSVSHPSTLNQWPMYDTIWSIHPQNQWQTLTLSDVGCLTWSYKNDTSMAIISQSECHCLHGWCTHDELRASQNQERFEFKLEKTCTGQIIIRRNRSLKTV